MDNLPLLIIAGLAALVGGYMLYERFGPTRCQQCGKRGGNKLVSEEVITREESTLTRRHMRSFAERRQHERRHGHQPTSTYPEQVPAQKLRSAKPSAVHTAAMSTPASKK
ncbi:MAG: hypothetical protein JNL34_11725 [Anaerolineae bacterium]|nr:hypothetical protein [Anaerolineae bacterium]